MPSKIPPAKARCVQCGLRFCKRPSSKETICAPCRRGESPAHGLLSTADRGCPCDPCRKVRNAHVRKRSVNWTKKPRTRECQCISCGKEFTAPRGCSDRPTKYCSRECRGWQHGDGKRTIGSHRRRAKHYGVEYQPLDRKAIFERDSWLCGICTDPVDPALQYPHRMAATLDHVIPLSRGGSHTADNVQCAHWECNVVIKRDSEVLSA